MTRPAGIDQVIPAIVEHDAVSNHTFEAQRLLRELGFDSEVYARIIGPGCDGRVRPIDELPRAFDASRWVLYQASIGSPAADVFARHPGRKLLDYHNITPARLVERWLPPLGDETRLGRKQLAELAPLVFYAFADSGFNAGELTEAGYALARVVPVLVDAGNFEARPDGATLARLGAAKQAGGADWLFVGQVAPHKAQHDVVKALACYRRAYDADARLHLVGREMGSAYLDALRRFCRALGLADAVEITGSVPTAVLAAHYDTADVFVCCSDHEGFCAPIVEAMHRRVPVVAYATAAVPETVGHGGLLLPSKDPVLVAAAVHQLLSDPPARATLVETGAAQAARYTLGNARAAFRAAIEEALALA
ncbi:MAG TPA: glycosyltransferase family 4 protein [Acidimicrobiales bacterium]|nr:glycosyltransferase family 4 protein [Acidimicrobiales bacterium]